jgi:hypothetical protein
MSTLLYSTSTLGCCFVASLSKLTTDSGPIIIRSKKIFISDLPLFAVGYSFTPVEPTGMVKVMRSYCEVVFA